MRVHLQTLGCRLNEAELETWSRDFQARGHQLTQDLAEADLMVLNTCAVTAEAVRKTRKLMHRAQRSNPKAKLVVSGCFASLDPQEAAQALGADLVVDNLDKDRLVEITERELGLPVMPEFATRPGQNSLLTRGRQRAFVKVQDGCRYQCTFCVVTIARGEERSRPVAAIVDEINQLQQQGIKEVVLTGVHIGGYGNGCDSDLQQLIQSLLRETEIPRLRLGAVEPWDLPPDFWQLFDDPRLMPHLHLPLQSGSDSVLRRMARRCKTAEFERLVQLARHRVNGFNLTTDIIVGFPGESDEEWRQTLEYVERIGFGHLHIFAYSPRPGTRAALMPGAVPKQVIQIRSRQLHQLGERMKKQTLESYAGRFMPVLIEGRQQSPVSGHGWSGYTPNFIKVLIPDTRQQNLENSIREVRLDRVSPCGGQLLGSLQEV
jgi:threonylcarbamoyladenosine tRNA methylthiotransferase MtaB